jgi:hypothetical protein
VIGGIVARLLYLVFLGLSLAGFSVDQPLTQDPPRPPASFIVFDMNGDGIVITSQADGVSFDLAGTGTPEKIGWTVKGSDDAFLVRDNNENGRVDSGTEMIGRRFKLGDQVITNGVNTLMMNLQGITVGPDGRSTDPRYQPGPIDPSFGFGRLDKDAPEFARLRLWTDTNHDGQSVPGELRTLAEAGVTMIGTGFRMYSKDPAAIDANGNRKLFSGFLRVLNRGSEFQRELIEFEPTRTSGPVSTAAAAAAVTPPPARFRQIREDGTSEVLVINLDGRGLCLTSAAEGVLSSPTSTVERNGWTCTGRQDAFVVSDQTRDGRIQGEILGGVMGPPNGFMYLEAVGRTKVIDVQAELYSTLGVWIDLNHDGQSQESELQSLAHAGIESISLSVKTARGDVKGNIVTGRSVAKRRGPNGLEDREVVSVKLATSK